MSTLPGTPTTTSASRAPGRVVFIGAGPGAADLITLRGARLLALAEVVLFDALTDPALQAMAPQARWINVGKRGYTGVQGSAAHGERSGQTRINALLVKHAREAGCVVRLKGGDPSVFGRLEEELEALALAGIACEVVPGVTAALAAAAATQRPLTRRGSGRSVSLSTAVTAVTAVTAASATGTDGAQHQPGSQPAISASRTADTEVFYMAGKALNTLSRRLQEAGWPADAPTSVVSRAGWPDQLHSDHPVASLGHAAVLHAGRPTVVTVGAGARPLALCPENRAASVKSPMAPLVGPPLSSIEP